MAKTVGSVNLSQQDKARAVAAYATLGSYTKAAQITGLKEQTLRYWAKQPWWLEELHRANSAESTELKTIYTSIAKKTAILLEERIEKGDEVVTKDGEIINKAVPARDLAIITGVMADKRKQLMEEPERVAIQNTQEKLLSLMDEFVRFSKAKPVKGEVIDAEQPQLQERLQTGSSDGEQATQARESDAQSSES